jgi:hypothetical protein
MTNKPNDIIRVDGIDIPLNAVSATLARAYQVAVHEVSVAPIGPMMNAAKSRMNAAATAILKEAAGNIALKISPRSHGSAGFFAAVNKRLA